MPGSIDVIIVGAGISGLVTARMLTAAGLNVVVLEARERVGGRLLNHHLGGGKALEMGGQWIGPTQTRILGLVKELGLQTFPTYNTGKNIVYWSGKKRTYSGNIPRLNPFALLDMLQAQTRFDRLAKKVPLEAPWEAKNARDLDSSTFETWIRRNTLTKTTGDLFRLFSQSIFAAESADFSLLHALFYTHAGGGVDRLTNTLNGAQQDRIVGGTQAICNRIANELADSIHLPAPVRQIEQGNDGVRVKTDDGTFYEASRVIVAIPPSLSARIVYRPALPAYRSQLLQRVPAGSVIKCMAIYDTPFWREEGLTGQAICNEGAVRVTYDNSPPDGSPGVLLAFLEGDEARSLSRATPAKRRQVVLDALANFFGERAASPVDYMDKDWSAEEWTGGCYGAHFPTGVWTSFGPVLREPIGRIHWAGTETATEWNGYIEGAVQSAERVVREILGANHM